MKQIDMPRIQNICIKGISVLLLTWFILVVTGSIISADEKSLFQERKEIQKAISFEYSKVAINLEKISSLETRLRNIDRQYKEHYSRIFISSGDINNLNNICRDQDDEVLRIICAYYLSILKDEPGLIINELLSIEDRAAFWKIGPILYSHPEDYDSKYRPLLFDEKGIMLEQAILFKIVDYVIDCVLKNAPGAFEVFLKLFLTSDASGEYFYDFIEELQSTHLDILKSNSSVLDQYCPSDRIKPLCESYSRN